MTEQDNLQEADGQKENTMTETDHSSKEIEETSEVSSAESETTEPEVPNVDIVEEKEGSNAMDGELTGTESETAGSEVPKDDIVDEIEESNAEDGEDDGVKDRHDIELKDYHSMSMEDIVSELNRLVKHEKVQAIKSHVDQIKKEFGDKFSHLLEEKKEEFLHDGGNEVDFYYSSPLKKRFNDIYKEYRDKRGSHYKNIEQNLKENLKNRLAIIDEIKGLLNVEESINSTYKHFKELQESWKTAGPIPRNDYRDVWNNYHHHVENFYDFLHLNRDLRDLDFKHNLDQKMKIIEQAEELAKEDNSNRAFRELQVLHKMWKEELGPVAKEHREEIWDRFSAATKAIHEKRQHYFAHLDEIYDQNLVKKNEIIANIDLVSNDESNNHSAWQKKIKMIEVLREEFFKAGKVPVKVNEATWKKFKESVRNFNRKKNNFYKSLKKDQYNNLQKKLDLIKIAEEHKDSDDYKTVTPLMKKIQSEWKSIGHVPRKDSDKIWKQFKSACNHYFDKFHAEKKAENKEEEDALTQKNEVLEKLKNIKLSGKQKDDMTLIKSHIEEWKKIGRVPQHKRFIEGKFNKAVEATYGKLDMDKNDIELIKFDNKLEILSNHQNSDHLDNERLYIRKKIDEIKSEINQLENNLQFFSNVKDDNPLVKEVHQNINNHKENLQLWVNKLKKIKAHY